MLRGTGRDHGYAGVWRAPEHFTFTFTPKVFEPVFLQFEILGERVGAKGAENFFFALPEGVFFFTRCVYTQNTQNFVENSKMFEKHRKIFDP